MSDNTTTESKETFDENVATNTVEEVTEKEESLVSTTENVNTVPTNVRVIVFVAWFSILFTLFIGPLVVYFFKRNIDYVNNEVGKAINVGLFLALLLSLYFLTAPLLLAVLYASANISIGCLAAYRGKVADLWACPDWMFKKNLEKKVSNPTKKVSKFVHK